MRSLKIKRKNIPEPWAAWTLFKPFNFNLGRIDKFDSWSCFKKIVSELGRHVKSD
jgi:hypothetical protein